jgi:ATP-dependent DNA helicase RecG
VASRLRKAGLIEGRKPNFYVSALIADATASKADYIRTRAQSDEFYAKLLMDYLKQYGQADRAEINTLLLDKLSDALSDEQKEDKISNLLTNLRRSGKIINAGSRKSPQWKIAE